VSAPVALYSRLTALAPTTAKAVPLATPEVFGYSDSFLAATLWDTGSVAAQLEGNGLGGTWSV